MRNIKKIRLFFKLAIHISPSYLVLLTLNTLLSSGRMIVNVILPKFLIDELMGKRDINMLLFWGGMIVVSNGLFHLLTNTIKRFLDVKEIYVREMMNQMMAKKIMDIEFYYLEDPYYLDLKERAVFAVRNHGAIAALIQALTATLQHVTTIIGLVTLLFILSPIFVGILIFTILIHLLVSRSFMRYTLKFFSELIPVNRKYGYYISLAFNDKIQKDIRLYQMNDMLTDKVRHYNLEINEWFTRFNKKMGKYLGMYKIINIFQSAIAYGYVGLRVFTDRFGSKIGIGSFTMYVNAAIQFTTTTVSLGESFMMVVQNLGFLDPFLEFMEIPNEDELDGKIPFTGEIETIEFKDVTFKYPKSDRIVLDRVSFSIQKGEKISIVGLNGAGKTTLIKLLCRLYRPTSGTIKINGHNIFDYDHDSYMKNIAAVFQDYKIFAFSIEENITCQPYQDDERAKEIVRQVKMEEKVQSLPNGMATFFGKAYDESGIEMSGGESQKIAIARALYKDASLIILDEPTSALDPLAEAEVYSQFNELVGNKTAIYISHRMSSSVFCDKILVIDNGKVVDFDHHNQLMKKTDQLYYKLFQAQAKNYQYS